MNKQQQKTALVDAPAGANHYTRKIAITVGGAALGLAGVADAGIIHHTGGGAAFTVVGTPGSSVDWDIDGDSAAEFTLTGSGFSTESAPYTYFYNSALIDAQGSNLLFGVGADLAVFNLGEAIGATAAATLSSANLFSATGTATSNSPVLTSSTSNSPFGNLDNLIGFQFYSGSDLLTGWANFRFNGGHPGSVEITEWAYCDTDGCEINAGEAPVPEPAAPSLLLLGLGAAGVARWKKNKRDAA